MKSAESRELTALCTVVTIFRWHSLWSLLKVGLWTSPVNLIVQDNLVGYIIPFKKTTGTKMADLHTKM